MQNIRSNHEQALVRLQQMTDRLKQEETKDWREVPCYSRSRQSVAASPNYEVMPEKLTA